MVRFHLPAGAMRAVGARGVSLLAAFLFSIIIARILGPQSAGAFFLIYTVVALLATVGRFGVDNLALRLLGGDTKTPLADTYRLLFLAAFASTIAFVMAILVICVLATEQVGMPTVVLVSTCVIAQAFTVVAGTVLRGLGRLAAGVFAELGSVPLLSSLLLLAGNAGFASGMSLERSLIAMTIAAWVSAAWSLPLALTVSRRSLTDSADHGGTFMEFVRLHFKRLASMMGTSALAYGLVWAPVFALSLTSDLSQVSFYSIALRVANMVALLPTIQISYLAPEFARRFYTGDLAGLNALAGRSALQVGVVTAVPLLVLIVMAGQIVTFLFGSDFGPAAPLTVILSVAVFLVMLVGQVNQLMLLCGLEVAALMLTFIGVIAWASLGIWLANVGGALAVAWLGGAVSVGYAVAASMLLRRRKGILSYARISSLL